MAETDLIEQVRHIAAEEYRRRRTIATRKVEAGELPAALAARDLRAWAAIAILCRAPGVMDAELADYRRTIVHYPGNGAPAVHGHLLPEHDARWDLARELCSREVWAPILAKARAAAIAKADTPERVERARNLNTLTRALNVPLAPPASSKAERIAA